MKFWRLRNMAAVAAALFLLAGAPTQADVKGGVIKIGVLTDESGMLADMAGPGSIEAARMAVEDFGGKVLGLPIEIVHADHQNKADLGASIARRWFDTDGVDMVTDLVNSSVALAVTDIGRTLGRITIPVTPGSLDLIGKQCSPYGALWVYDTYATSAALARNIVAKGDKTWFFLAADYAFGRSMVDEASKAIAAAGGRVVGTAYHPQGTTDFASYMLTAQASGAQVIGLANSSNDLINALKQAREFGIDPRKQKLAATIVTLTDVDAMGLEVGQNLTFLTGFYWDLDEQTRLWSRRFFERHKRMPTQFQAGMYSAVTHYLRAVQAAGTDDAAQVIGKMRAMPIDDMFSRHGFLRADGRMVHDMLLVQVKTPEASKYPWDYYDVLETVPGKDAFRALSSSDCPYLK
ncbi:MAG: ABC transporter substrate-binding protein [Janthinobacterium lividum]